MQQSHYQKLTDHSQRWEAAAARERPPTAVRSEGLRVAGSVRAPRARTFAPAPGGRQPLNFGDFGGGSAVSPALARLQVMRGPQIPEDTKALKTLSPANMPRKQRLKTDPTRMNVRGRVRMAKRTKVLVPFRGSESDVSDSLLKGQ
ncbi:hypothetical protein HispidOSU_031193 [Sigmodon hispidus]